MGRDYTVLNTGKGTCPVCGADHKNSNTCKQWSESGVISCYRETTADIGEELNGYRFTGTDEAGFGKWKPAEKWDETPTATPPAKSARKAGKRVWNYTRIMDSTHTPEVEVTRVDSADGKKFFQSKVENEFNLLDELTDIYSALAPLYYGEVLKRALDGEPIFLAEGEATADALRSVGLNGTTLNKNAPKETLKAALIDRGVHASQIVVCPDQDKVGVKDSQKVAEVIPGCRFMHAFPGTAQWNGQMPDGGGLDAFDWIEQGATAEDVMSNVVDDLVQISSKGKSDLKQRSAQLKELVSELALAKLDPVSSGMDRTEVGMLENDICQKMHIGKKQLQGLVLQEALDILDVNTDHNRTTVEVDSDWFEDDLEDDSSDEGAAFIPGFAYPGHMTAFAASAGKGKSEVMTEMTMRCIKGEPTLPYSDLQTNCSNSILIIATDQGEQAARQTRDSFYRAGAESGRDLQGRVDLVAENPKKGISPWKATLPHIRRLQQMVNSKQYDIVWLDAVRSACYGSAFDPTSNEDMHMLCVILKAIVCRTGAALVVLNHLAGGDPIKPSDFVPENMAGGKTLGQTVDIVYFLSAKDDLETDQVERYLHVVKVRGGTEQFAIRYERDESTGRMVSLKRDGSAVEDDVLTILAILEEADIKPTTAETLSRRMGRAPKTVRNKLTAMGQQKLIRRKGRGWVLAAGGSRVLDAETTYIRPWDEGEDDDIF